MILPKNVFDLSFCTLMLLLDSCTYSNLSPNIDCIQKNLGEYDVKGVSTIGFISPPPPPNHFNDTITFTKNGSAIELVINGNKVNVGQADGCNFKLSFDNGKGTGSGKFHNDSVFLWTYDRNSLCCYVSDSIWGKKIK